MGTTYYYEGNNDPHELTEKITGIGEDGNDELVVGGEPKELTDEQIARLSSRYRLVSEEQRAEQEKVESEATAAPSTGEKSTPDPSPSSDGESGDDAGAGETSTPEPSAAASSGAGRRGGRQT